MKAVFDALARLNSDLLKAKVDRPRWRTLTAPAANGNLFVPMRGNVQQADINAAINIGLRALAAPDNHEIHLRIRSVRDGDKITVRAENVRENARWSQGRPAIEVLPQTKEALATRSIRFFSRTSET